MMLNHNKIIKIFYIPTGVLSSCNFCSICYTTEENSAFEGFVLSWIFNGCVRTQKFLAEHIYLAKNAANLLSE